LEVDVCGDGDRGAGKGLSALTSGDKFEFARARGKLSELTPELSVLSEKQRI